MALLNKVVKGEIMTWVKPTLEPLESRMLSWGLGCEAGSSDIHVCSGGNGAANRCMIGQAPNAAAVCTNGQFVNTTAASL